MAPKRHTTCRVCGAPRIENREAVALCAEHLREYRRDKSARSRMHAPAADLEYRRVHSYYDLATSMGANEDEAWWCAMAAEGAFKQATTHGFRSRAVIADELAWLRANATTLARLDDRPWRAPAGDSANMQDDGWDELEAAS